MKSDMEQKYTSTGIKFWRHRLAMTSYKKNMGHSVISTHISPEGTCNLHCSYCSVKKRNQELRISPSTIHRYVLKLQSRGLKAVILTGGGEPLLYPYITPLVHWLGMERKLKLALITNGTVSDKLNDEVWKHFSWIRVSINRELMSKISIPTKHLNRNCIVGGSKVVTFKDTLDDMHQAVEVADRIGARYVRVLPDCTQKDEDVNQAHLRIDELLAELDDPRFFRQHKRKASPKCKKCHQAYFRPYLSEEVFKGTQESGSVYPCDSVVLNSQATRFEQKYQLCRAADVLEFMEGRIGQSFDASKDCPGCVFTENVNMLDDWKNTGIDRFKEFPEQLVHEAFI